MRRHHEVVTDQYGNRNQGSQSRKEWVGNILVFQGARKCFKKGLKMTRSLLNAPCGHICNKYNFEVNKDVVTLRCSD